jgi:hypothetical protein
MARYRFTPMEVSWENPDDPVWSPDGKGFAYDAQVAGIRQIILRYLNSPTPIQLTQGSTDAMAVGWSGDGKRVISAGNNPRAEERPSALFSTPVFGGEAEQLLTANIDYAAVSGDGRAIAAIIEEEDGKLVVKHLRPSALPSRDMFLRPLKQNNHFENLISDFRRMGSGYWCFWTNPRGGCCGICLGPRAGRLPASYPYRAFLLPNSPLHLVTRQPAISSSRFGSGRTSNTSTCGLWM